MSSINSARNETQNRENENSLHNLRYVEVIALFLLFSDESFALYFTTTTLAQDPAIYDFNNDYDYEGASSILFLSFFFFYNL